MQKSLGLAVLSAIFVPLLAVAQASSGQTSHPSKHTARSNEPAMPPVALPDEPGTYAVIYTSMGNIVCRLFPQDAPKAVANFSGLATGSKAWTDPATGQVKHTALYTGTIFHRVIPDFMIQGGDPLGNDPLQAGRGDPGYQFEDEVSSGKTFDKPGVLAMANSGPNTNGSQFFITVSPQPRLNGGYTIFGEVVSGQDVVDAISKVPRNEEDRPLAPVTIKRIVIKKVTAPKTAASAKSSTSK